MSKGLLITGATGNQGGAAINALITSPSDLSDFTILAVTRNANSPSARKLENKAVNMKIVQGDMNDVPSLFKAAKEQHSNIWGVFSVQAQGDERAQGEAMVNEALKQGVKQFVQASVDRGGEASIDNPTEVPHFQPKYYVERHLIEKTKGTDMKYTILRPVAFMDNMKPGFPAKMFGALLNSRLGEKKSLQWVAVKDIGHFAAQAFIDPVKFRNRSLSIAGDELTMPQMDAAFREAVGHPMPATYGFLGGIIPLMSKDFAEMMKFFQTTGYAADIPALRKEYSGMTDFKTWLRTDSAFAKKP